MPLRNICLLTTAVQVFSMLTFFSLWTVPPPKVGDTAYGQVLRCIHAPISPHQTSTNCSKEAPRSILAEHCIPNANINGICSKFIKYETVTSDELGFYPVAKQKKQCALSELVNDCSMLINAHEYNIGPVSPEEKEFPLAFAIKMHTAPDQAEQLLRTIYRPHNTYCLYVDAKSHFIVYQTMLKLSKCFPNVHVIKDRIKVIYASSAHVQSELQCMKKCIEVDKTWKYYLNLAGQEFPLKTNYEIVSILKTLNGANDIESYTHPSYLKWRHEKVHRITETSIVETSATRKPWRFTIPISKGSAYGAFSRNFVDFILNDEIAQDFIRYMNDTYSPEESVWATLNTFPWAPGGYELEIRHKFNTFLSHASIWDNDRVKCEGKFVRSVCVFKSEDLAWLVSRQQLFANKFDYSYNSISLDCLENLIRNRTLHPDILTLDWHYYRNLPHAHFYSDYSRIEKMGSLLDLKEKWLKEQAVKTETELLILHARTEKSSTDTSLPGSEIQMYHVES